MRILGIDLSTTRAKMVEIDTVFSKFEIQEYHEIDMEGSEAVGVHLAQFIDRLPRPPDKICVLLPASRGTFRNLRFPTKDKKAIRASLEFELEDELPFDVDQSVMSWSIMSQASHSSDLHVAASLETSFAEWFEGVVMGGFDPDVVTSEAWALKVLLNRIFAKDPPTKPILVLELGDKRSLIYAHHDGKPILAREINWGGHDLTAKLAEYYSIPTEQAEKAKKESGFVLPVTDSEGVSQDQIEFSNVIRAAFEPMITALRQSLFATKNITKEHPEAIYLSGGSSQMPGLLPSLEEEFKIKVSRLSSLTRLAESTGVSYSEETDARFTLATAAALCLLSPEKASLINFRKGKFGKQGAHGNGFQFETLKRPLLQAGFLLALCVLSLSIESSQIEKRTVQTDEQYEKTIKRLFPALGIRDLRKYVDSPDEVRKSIQKDLNRERSLAKLNEVNPKSPLSGLRTLSNRIGRDIPTEISEMVLGIRDSDKPWSRELEQEASFTFRVQNPQMADRLSDRVEREFQLKRSPIEEIKSELPDTLRLKVKYTGTPSDSIYGKNP